MQNLFDTQQYNTLKERIENIEPTSQRVFGFMDVAQMMGHCNLQIESALGKYQTEDESNFFSRTVIRRVLPFIKKIPQGQKTGKSLIVSEIRNFDAEKRRLLQNLDDAYNRGATGRWFAHPKFGRMSGKEWGHLIFIHLDHHLRQFSN